MAGALSQVITESIANPGPGSNRFVTYSLYI
jgi:hypothetical protein